LVDVKIGVPVHVALFGPKTLNVIVPVGAWPVSVAVSEMGWPTVAVGVAVVVSCGVDWASTLISPASPQVVLTEALAASPEYVAIQKYEAARVGVKGADVAVGGVPESGRLALVNTGVPEQAGLSKAWKVTVPVGF
jgi:hypothetical protein